MLRHRKNIDQLSVAEIEQLLRIKQRQERQDRFSRLVANGSSANAALLAGDQPRSTPLVLPAQTPVTIPIQHTETVFQQTQQRVPVKANKPRKVRDFILLLIEIGAMIGLVFVFIGSYLNLRTLNQEAENTQTNAIAALNAGPIDTNAAVAQPIWSIDRLPGGHTPPTLNGGAMPEVPPHLQNWVQPGPIVPISAQTTAIATRLVIPKINIDAPIVQGVTWEDLKKGVGHLPNSAQPGERGNMYLAAHNDIFGEIFRHLDKLNVGDKFYVYAGEAKYTYIIREKRIIEPTEVDVMLPTTEPVATLQTCYPYLIDTHRLIAVADLVN